MQLIIVWGQREGGAQVVAFWRRGGALWDNQARFLSFSSSFLPCKMFFYKHFFCKTLRNLNPCFFLFSLRTKLFRRKFHFHRFVTWSPFGESFGRERRAFLCPVFKPTFLAQIRPNFAQTLLLSPLFSSLNRLMQIGKSKYFLKSFWRLLDRLAAFRAIKGFVLGNILVEIEGGITGWYHSLLI